MEEGGEIFEIGLPRWGGEGGEFVDGAGDGAGVEGGGEEGRDQVG